MIIPERALVLLIMFLALSACEGTEALRRFDEAIGCYKTQAGEPVLHIAPNAIVTDARGVELGIASLRVEGDVSLLNFVPAVVAAPDGTRATAAPESARAHMIDTLGGETILALQRRDMTAPPILVKRFPGMC